MCATVPNARSMTRHVNMDLSKSSPKSPASVYTLLSHGLSLSHSPPAAKTGAMWFHTLTFDV